MRFFLFFLLTLIPALMHANDTHSCARPQEIAVRHLTLKLKLNFEKKIAEGSALLQLERKPGFHELWVDTRQMDINSVVDEHGNKLKYELQDEKPWMGRPLKIVLNDNTQSVSIAYSTTPESAALQWLNPEQTEGKKHPFLFTQGQAILSRTWIPIQDSPGIRFTWDAEISVPQDLMAVMSGNNPQEKNTEGIYKFRMTQPVPAYLVALAVGDLSFERLSDRTGVYAEPSMLPRAASELEDMEKMLVAAEALYGTYQWGRYDVIVLPPSFPFGGMENPRLTFATPTIIAGDRSLTSLIAHELAHSWSGNLVTNVTWNDFWLNEGFTVYFERRIMESLYGKDYSDMLSVLGYQDLQETLKELGPESEDTKLKLSLEGRDADDGMNDIAYEKGCLFLTSIEKKVGRTAFDAFVKSYFKEFAFSSISTEDFVKYLNRRLTLPEGIDLQVNEWIYKPGIPAGVEAAVSMRFKQVDAVLMSWTSGEIPAAGLVVNGWTTHEWLQFIRHLPSSLTESQMKELDATFGFTKSGNSEIQFAWFIAVIPNQYMAADASLEAFLRRVGRRKFVLPLYTSMLNEDRLSSKARAIYKEARTGYHAVTMQSLDELFAKK
jgi:leukotriene-A4 hydrolase